MGGKWNEIKYSESSHFNVQDVFKLKGTGSLSRAVIFGKFVTQVRSIITERSIVLLVSCSWHTHNKPVLHGLRGLELVDQAYILVQGHPALCRSAPTLWNLSFDSQEAQCSGLMTGVIWFISFATAPRDYQHRPLPFRKVSFLLSYKWRTERSPPAPLVDWRARLLLLWPWSHRATLLRGRLRRLALTTGVR